MTIYIIIAVMCLLPVFGGRAQMRLAIENGKRILLPVSKRSISYKSQRMISIVILCILCFITGFRSFNMGNDTYEYTVFYQRIASDGIGIYDLELGYQLFNLFLSKINSDPHFLFIICAVLSYWGIGKYIFDNSYDVSFSVCLIFATLFSFYMSGIRQSLAMVCVLYAYGKMRHRRPIQAFFLILTGALFHATAFIALLLFAYEFFPRKMTVVLWICLSTAVLSATGILNRLLAVILKEYANFFYSHYAGTGWLAVFVNLVFNLVFFYFIFRACSRDWSRQENRLAAANAFLLLLCSCLGFSVSQFTRAAYYFELIACVDLPNALCYRKDRKFWVCLISVVLIVYFFVVLIYRPGWNHLYPYEFWNA